jgi:hypothetical protein
MRPSRTHSVWAIVLFFIVAASVAWAAFVPERVTTGTGSGIPDGIDPAGDRNNSYAWCMEVLPQTDGDYLYVGSNRNLAYFIYGGSNMSSEEIENLSLNYLDGDLPYEQPGATDFRAKIFRYKLDGTRPWEEVYQSPTLSVSGDVTLGRESGFRGMETFSPVGQDPSLFVVTFNQGSPNPVCRVLRIRPDFGPGDTPEEVYTESTDTLRGITTHDGKLFIGTNGNRGITPAVWCAEDPVSQDSWTPVLYPSDIGRNSVGVWDLISYKGSLYVFAGTRVYKGRYVGSGDPAANPETGWVWETVVGSGASQDAKYPTGLGNPRIAAMSPFLFSTGGEDYVYVTTFANMPVALAYLAAALNGSVSADVAFSQFFARLDPAQVYRFDENDDWEMIIGDLKNNVYPTSDDWGSLEGTQVFDSRLGNYGAGFFNPSLLQQLQGDDTNLSFNQYTWWMDTYNGKLYCTTFDYRIFTRYIRERTSDPEVIARLDMIDQNNTNPQGFDLYATTDGINWDPVTQDGFGDPYNYGGRTLKSTPEGLFVGTANPFWGAQVWKVTETAEGSGGGGGCSSAGLVPLGLFLLAPLFGLARKK